MQTDTRYDVIIVGAGPAGALLGYYLALSNIKVMILDKKSPPRYKACGGGLTRRAVNALPFDISEVVEDKTCTVHMLYQNRPLHTKTFANPVIEMVMRDRFDAFLIEKALLKGASFQGDTVFKKLFGTPGNLTVETSKGAIRTKMVVGADGVNSKVRKELGLRVNGGYMTALEGELFPKRAMDLERFRGVVHYDFGVIPGGYGWIFPKKNHLSVGVGTFFSTAEGWRKVLKDYLQLKGLTAVDKIKPLKGHLIPVRPKPGNILSNPKGLLVGDAAGIADPLTGEGLFFAFQGAKIASEIIGQALVSDFARMTHYTKAIKNQFQKDLVYADIMSRIIYALPRLGEKILTCHSEELAAKQLAVICGDLTYSRLFKSLILKTMNPAAVLPVLFS